MDEEKALLDAPTEDAAFNDMVQQELRENWQKLEDLEQKIRLLLLPKDANDAQYRTPEEDIIIALDVSHNLAQSLLRGHPVGCLEELGIDIIG